MLKEQWCENFGNGVVWWKRIHEIIVSEEED